MAQARTIEQLLTVPWISTDQNVVGALDELLGTIYSLIIAQHLGYKDRVGEPIVISPLLVRANAVGRRDPIERNVDGRVLHEQRHLPHSIPLPSRAQNRHRQKSSTAKSLVRTPTNNDSRHKQNERRLKPASD